MGRWQPSCAMALSCPGWDILPGVSGECCPSVSSSVLQWKLKQVMDCILLGVLTQIGQEKDNFLDSGLSHHSEHKAIWLWGQEYLKSILATNK